MNATIEIYYDDDEDSKYFDSEFSVEFDFTAYYTPARINCPIEDSCPEEGDSSYEVQKISVNGEELTFSDLSQDIRVTIHNGVQEWVDENGLREIEEDDDERRGEAQYDAQEDAADFYADRGW